MRTFVLILLVAATATAQESSDPESGSARPASDREFLPGTPGTSIAGLGQRVYPLMNVDVVDRSGARAGLVAFHRVSGENRFVGYLGAAEIEVPYEKIKSVRIQAAEDPGGRMQARLQLHSGKTVDATFDEREGEQLFAGYADFGRVTVYWRDLRELQFTARTKTSDLPRYGRATGGVDVRLKDAEGVETELVAFTRSSGDNVLAGLRGQMRVEVPLRIVRTARLRRLERSPLLACDLELKEKRSLELRVKRYEEVAVYRGRAEFGELRIRFSEIRELTVHRSTPALRDLDPVAAAEGREVELGKDPAR